MKYNTKFFKDAFPEWKRKKDSVLLRWFYRPISFFGASIFAHTGLTSNQVSFLSMIVAIVACSMFLFSNEIINYVGWFLLVLWMIMDCIDGNLARSIKSYPYGDFIDAASSYTLIALMFPCLGINAFLNGGFFFQKGFVWLVFLGAITGISDVLARLFYQKYLTNSYEYNDNNADNTVKKTGKLAIINDRVGKELGLNGLLIPALLLCLIFGMRFLFSFLVLLKKTKCLKK